MSASSSTLGPRPCDLKPKTEIRTPNFETFHVSSKRQALLASAPRHYATLACNPKAGALAVHSTPATGSTLNIRHTLDAADHVPDDRCCRQCTVVRYITRSIVKFSKH
eukprot:145908-Rhodomonas_salina.2